MSGTSGAVPNRRDLTCWVRSEARIWQKKEEMGLVTSWSSFPVLFLKAQPLKLAKGESFLPGESGSRRGQENSMHLSSLFSFFCQVLVANTAESLEPHLLTLRGCGSRKGTARAHGWQLLTFLLCRCTFTLVFRLQLPVSRSLCHLERWSPSRRQAGFCHLVSSSRVAVVQSCGNKGQLLLTDVYRQDQSNLFPLKILPKGGGHGAQNHF